MTTPLTNLFRFALIGLTVLSTRAWSADISPPFPAPDFTERSPEAWINSKPLHIEDLRGKVVLLDFWTFDCWNCYRSFPWLKALEDRFEPKGLQVIGIHTPEFRHERDRDNVIAKVENFKLHHPVMMDNGFTFWKAMNNRYWPTFYLIDKAGKVRFRHIGETHPGDRNAKSMEREIELLLKE